MHDIDKGKICIRLAKQDDFAVIVELVGSLLTELGDRPLSINDVTEFYDDIIGGKYGSFVTLVEYDGQCIGVCSVSLLPSFRARGVYGIIQEMYIAERYRSQGIGNPLLNYSLSHAGTLGCRFIELGTPLHGIRQNQFYAQSNFKVVGDRLRCYLV